MSLCDLCDSVFPIRVFNPIFQSVFPCRMSCIWMDCDQVKNLNSNLVSTMLPAFLGLGQASWFGEAKNVFDLADESRQMGVLPQRVQQLAR